MLVSITTVLFTIYYIYKGFHWTHTHAVVTRLKKREERKKIKESSSCKILICMLFCRICWWLKYCIYKKRVIMHSLSYNRWSFISKQFLQERILFLWKYKQFFQFTRQTKCWRYEWKIYLICFGLVLELNLNMYSLNYFTVICNCNDYQCLCCS